MIVGVEEATYLLLLVAPHQPFAIVHAPNELVLIRRSSFHRIVELIDPSEQLFTQTVRALLSYLAAPVQATRRTRHYLDVLVGARVPLQLLHNVLNVSKPIGDGKSQLYFAVQHQVDLFEVNIAQLRVNDVLMFEFVAEKSARRIDEHIFQVAARAATKVSVNVLLFAQLFFAQHLRCVGRLFNKPFLFQKKEDN